MAMGAGVTLRREGELLLASISHPPVNALSHAVRAGLMAALDAAEKDPGIRALILLGAGKNFSAGADVREFGQPFRAPELGAVVERTEGFGKPVIAALHGNALGGGLELALACHFRIALEGTKLALPEVRLGIIPGAGGTQRLPRLIGAAAALGVIAEGRELSAAEALKLGLVDECVAQDLEGAAIRFARKLLQDGSVVRRTGEIDPGPLDEALFEQAARNVARRQRGFQAPLEAIRAVRLAHELPLKEGLARELEICMALLNGEQSRAQRHAFAAEREIARIPGLAPDTPVRALQQAAVIGSGVMGRGIAMTLAGAGIRVTLTGRSLASARDALGAIARSYESAVGRGALTAAVAAERLALIMPAEEERAAGAADLVVEAISENLADKTALFARLGARCRTGAILASNTSFLDLGALAAASGRPADVAGLHFFNPAHLMRLVEVVRTPDTAPEVVASLLALARRLGKIPVLVGAKEGFVANRMLARRSREALFLVEEGALPEEVDRALVDFGFPAGPFAVQDLGGLDVVLATRRARFGSLSERERQADLLEQLHAAGRLGQKSGAGWYRYDDERRAQPDPAVAALIARHCARRGIVRRAIGATEITERCLYAMINEGARLLEEGIVPRAQEIDVIWLHGFGFPAYRGGPMFYADQVGLGQVLGRLNEYRRSVGEEYFSPAPLIERLAAAGRGFYGS